MSNSPSASTTTRRPSSSLHTRLVQMWEAVYKETSGRVVCKVFAQNNNIQGSDPAALKALVAGEIQFFTLMGGILGTMMPAAEVQQVPFAFRSAAHAHRAMDGPLGAYLIEEMAAKGIHGFRTGAFDNGMREITANKRIASPADLAGLKMRVPAGQLVADTFKAFGCEPVIINSDSIYAALKDGRADAQENPLTLADQFKLYEVVKYVAMTDHMWSGFNLLAHLADVAAHPCRPPGGHRSQRHEVRASCSGRIRSPRTRGCAPSWPRAGSSSTRRTRRRSRNSSRASTRRGRRSSARSAGSCSRTARGRV